MMESLYPHLISALVAVVLVVVGFFMGRMTKHIIFKDGVSIEAGLPKIDLHEEDPIDIIDDAVPNLTRIPTIMR